MTARSDGIRDMQSLLGRCIQDEAGCMVHQGATKGGSGVVWMTGHGVVSLPKAFALCLNGRPAPKGRIWIPTCGNLLCCSPGHRVLGGRSDLMKIIRPALSTLHKARIAVARRRNGKLFSVEVRDAILRSDGTGKEVGAKFGMSHDHVSRIRRGEAWRDYSGSVFSWRPE